AVNKFKFACCKITSSGGGGGGGRGGGGRGGGGRGGGGSDSTWGSYDGLASELGVQASSALVYVSFDRKVLTRKHGAASHEEFLGLLAKMAAENNGRWKKTDEANHDLAQVEKWIEQKKVGDASRRLNIVLDKSGQVAKSVGEKAKELVEKV